MSFSIEALFYKDESQLGKLKSSQCADFQLKPNDQSKDTFAVLQRWSNAGAVGMQACSRWHWKLLIESHAQINNAPLFKAGNNKKLNDCTYWIRNIFSSILLSTYFATQMLQRLARLTRLLFYVTLIHLKTRVTVSYCGTVKSCRLSVELKWLYSVTSTDLGCCNLFCLLQRFHLLLFLTT